MANPEKVIIRLKEGKTQNYIEAYQKIFGGEFSGNVYVLERGKTKIKARVYPILPGFEIATTDAIYGETTEMIREPDDNPEFFHFNLLKEGQFEQNFNNQYSLMEAGSSKGVFIQNGLFPMRAQVSANSILKSVAFKITSEALKSLIPEASGIIERLFDDDEPIAYHTSLPIQLGKMLDDMFYLGDAEFGKTPLVVAKGLELFTLLLKSVTEMVKKDELHGLHIDDYEKLLKIKEHLLNSIEDRISVEELASEFGISNSKLKRDFKTLFDCSVYQFYTQARMDEAYRRLQTGKYSVMEVGYGLGYQNLSKFSQMFKKIKGINPKEVMPV
jgi:AraC-like DNA-binding protein